MKSGLITAPFGYRTEAQRTAGNPRRLPSKQGGTVAASLAADYGPFPG